MNCHPIPVLYLDHCHDLSPAFEQTLSNAAVLALTRVADLKSALTKLADEKFEAMLVDLEYNQNSDTLAKIHQAVPLLALVLVADATDEPKAIQAAHTGASDYLIRDHCDHVTLTHLIHSAIERQHLAESLRDSEDRYQKLVEVSPEGIAIHQHGKFVFVNPAAVKLLGASSPQEIVGKPILQVVVPGFHNVVLERNRQLANGNEIPALEEKFIRMDGSTFDVQVVATPITFRGEPATQVLVHDITERKIAEQELRASEERFRTLNELAPIGIFLTDPEGKTTYTNRRWQAILGMSPEECLGHYWCEIAHAEDSERLHRQVDHALELGQEFNGEFRIRTQQGETRWVKMNSIALRDADAKLAGRIGTIEDITQQKQNERKLQALTNIGSALRVAETRAQMLPMILNQLMDLVHSTGALFAMRDPTSDDVTIELALGTSQSLTGLRVPAGEGMFASVISNGKPYTNELESPNHPRGSKPVAYAPLSAQGEIIGVLSVSRTENSYTPEELEMLIAIAGISADAIQRALLHEQTETRLRQLTSLRNIDHAINSSLDLRVTLDVLIDQVISQLKTDAACIMLLKPKSPVLEFIAGKGFRTRSVQKTQVWLGQNYVGHVALNRKTIAIRDYRSSQHAAETTPNFATMMETERFIGYCAVPLVAKGQVKGVLEIFQRAPLNQDAEWLAFLEALAGQAAIAIDNASLFDGLQQANIEMMAAYDATIEGWSRALDLRDHETEGHSTRVTELTLELARQFGMSDPELVHIRRGALLHDIGKMGVPDSILRKPSALNDEELTYMRRHPELAFQLLSPIEYLRPALDIPLCHHEKWDGTGYPQGLKGEAIPLVARIFAVVDVWDALTSDRPYRPAWSSEQARAYIRAQAGKHFDPRVVEMFLKLANRV